MGLEIVIRWLCSLYLFLYSEIPGLIAVGYGVGFVDMSITQWLILPFLCVITEQYKCALEFYVVEMQSRAEAVIIMKLTARIFLYT